MDLQSLFYLVSIIFMSLLIAVMIGILVTIIIIQRKISALHHTLETRVQSLFDDPSNLAAQIGIGITENLMKRARTIFKK